jgi:putative drug exporter of the RND superfamily
VQFMASLRVGSPDSNAAISLVPTMRADLDAAAARAHASDDGVAGDSPSLYDVRTASHNDLVRIVPVAVIIIGLLLSLLLRSAVAPLYLVVSVALSYLASLGASVLVFQVFGGSDGLSFILPFLMFVFLLALGEDYNILVMSRIREEAHELPLRTAVARAIEVTGTTVTSAGMVLAGTFLVFAIAGASGADGSQIREIGVGLAIGVALDTFVVRTLVVPSTVVLLGRWNWWPDALHDRHVVLERHARLPVTELAGESPGA